MSWLRLLIYSAAALWLGYLVLATPEITVFQLAGDRGYIGVPASLEGWSLAEGSGDLLVQGHTRLGLMTLEVERTGVPLDGALTAYISQRHARLFLDHDDYQVRLKGEYQPFGIHHVPTARAVYDGELLGLKVRMVQHDAYWLLDERYVRIGMRFPEFLDRYFWADQYFIATYLNLRLPPEEADK
ncbi:MAG TPA: hypothetical protein VNT75_18075 [Symbiobacteriaceae bacterium]|nr:hypothetical protein [Symbiobacteriaceae bacterium]